MANSSDYPIVHASAAAENKPYSPVNTARSHDRRALDAPELYLEVPKYPVAHSSTAPETVTSDDKEVSSARLPFRRPTHRKRILGYTPATFALIASLVLLVIGAAIGGGVGGHLAAANKPTATTTVTAQTNPNPTATASHHTAPTTAPNNTTTTTTPTFHFTLYASPSFLGAAHAVPSAANVSLPWRVRSYVWDQRGSACCALFCRDGRDVGYRCSGVTYQDDVGGGGSENGVDGVAVQCDGEEGGGVGDNQGGTVAPPGGWCGGL